MALVLNIKRVVKDRHGIQGEVECFASDFTDKNGKRYLQVDTTGSPLRKAKDEVNQSIRFDEHSASQLKLLIEETFPSLKNPDLRAMPPIYAGK